MTKSNLVNANGKIQIFYYGGAAPTVEDYLMHTNLLIDELMKKARDHNVSDKEFVFTQRTVHLLFPHTYKISQYLSTSHVLFSYSWEYPKMYKVDYKKDDINIEAYVDITYNSVKLLLDLLNIHLNGFPEANNEFSFQNLANSGCFGKPTGEFNWKKLL